MNTQIEWEETETHLRKELNFSDFNEAWGFVSRVALIAEAMQHHPDIQVCYNRVVLTLSTHDAGGVVTDDDRAVAHEIDKILK